ncbi:Arm DNA-binding domain-containing protein [Dyadobacter sp. CY261]|uniref:Arm DNA-binding domain-containing protein n=1 Tax=Dyadobacter sp. CY261 TaxID=2907203 RepID=UPI001F34B4B8|nr:Arm DNA-binding domain-containing protein [Dyadobacter sp. CY261]MCF0075726.1 Arm DNA-binding domain-containing protein [Dyadobacter sp. CY261]
MVAGFTCTFKKNGVSYWLMKYYYLSKEKLLAFGSYPTVTLAEPRNKRDTAKKLLANGQDPRRPRRQTSMITL